MKLVTTKLFKKTGSAGKIVALSVASSLLMSVAAQASSVIAFTPQNSGSPFNQSGTTGGVGWNVNITGANFSATPYVQAAGTDTQGLQTINEVSWQTAELAPSGPTSSVTFTLSFDQPVVNLEFAMRSFGLLLKDVAGFDKDGGIQTFTLTAFNDAQVIQASAIDAFAGNLIALSASGNSIIGNALVQDLNGGTVLPGSPADLEARRAYFSIDDAVTRVVLSFHADAFTTAINTDTIRIRDISFNAIPEPSVALLGVLGGLTMLRRNRR